MASHNDDARLVRAAVDGDRTALLILYQDRLALLRAVISRSLRSRHDVDDVLQDVWLEAGQSIRSFAFRSSFSTWLVSIAKRTAIDTYRRARRADSYRPTSPRDTADPTTSILLVIDLERAMNRLPPVYRHALMAYAIAGHNHRDIADRLRIASGTSKARLHRARIACRQHMLDHNVLPSALRVDESSAA